MCGPLLCVSQYLHMWLPTYAPSHSPFNLYSSDVTLPWSSCLIHQWIIFCIVKGVVVGRVTINCSFRPIATMVSSPLLFPFKLLLVCAPSSPQWSAMHIHTHTFASVCVCVHIHVCYNVCGIYIKLWASVRRSSGRFMWEKQTPFHGARKLK